MSALRVGEMIRQARRKQGLAQAELAGRLNVSQATVSSWETERLTPNDDQLAVLEQVLDTALSAAGISTSLTWKDAIVHVLSSSGEAMAYSDITEQIVDRGLRTSVGPTPANTVYAIIHKSLHDEGGDSPFYKAGPGTFGLRVHQEPAAQWSPDEEHSDGLEEVVVETDRTIIRALGMFWLREKVEWKRNPAILGRQHIGADNVDFAGQRGVYLLHDRHKVVYVGRSVDRPLGQRLYEHTRDRHSGRWDRFSWFGLLDIDQNGQLNPEMPTASGEAVINALEAILIECLEPPQNRRRGDHLDAVEFIQRPDPEIDRKKRQELMQDLLSQVK
ncbi:MAG: helix-turn-helix domain-containing protein [bacterium]|nr:helix-turn-helix domain-containing protein [bacterium]